MQSVIILSVLYGVAQSANYQRYGDNGYSTYSPYSTMANLYNQYPKTVSYGSDIANFPTATRYPNYGPGYTTSGPNRDYMYTTQRANTFYVPGVSTQRYDQSYGQGYGQGSGQSYDQGSGRGYGQGYSNRYDQGYSSYELPFMQGMGEYCVKRSPQVVISVEDMMGMWYGAEIIQHLAGDSRVDYTETCIVVHISEPKDKPSTENQLFHVQHLNSKFRHEYRHLRLLWNEAGQSLEYSLYFKNSSAGYWQVFDAQNGTMPASQRYQQFSGTVQVLKAVKDHLVLNWCQEAKNGRPAQLYTVLFTRKPGSMPDWEIDAVHTMLQSKKLSVASRRMVCGNSADKPLYSLVATVMMYALTYVISS